MAAYGEVGPSDDSRGGGARGGGVGGRQATDGSSVYGVGVAGGGVYGLHSLPQSEEVDKALLAARAGFTQVMLHPFDGVMAQALPCSEH